MTDEQRAAVERLRKLQQPKSTVGKVYAGLGDGRFINELHENDIAAVADMYLAEHPADDCLAVDEEWLRSVGGVERRDVRAMRYGPGQPILRFMFGNLSVSSLEGEEDYYWHMAIGGIDFPDAGYDFPIFDLPATRGDVRRLCAALGIELKPK